jgi:hypothetical protein
VCLDWDRPDIRRDADAGSTDMIVLSGSRVDLEVKVEGKRDFFGGGPGIDTWY